MGVRYDVEIRYLQSGSLGAQSQQIARLGKDLDRATSSFGNAISGALSSAATAAVATGAAIATAIGGAITYAIAGVQAELETTKIALATIFGARGVSRGFADGLQMSEEVLQLIRKDARELPGEFKDLVGIMQSISSAGFMSGMNTRQVEKFSARTMALAAVAKVPYEVASREMAAMLEGNVRQQNVLYRRLFAGIGTPKQLNKMSSKERREAIEKEMNKPAYDSAIKAYANTFTGQFTTLKDRLKYDILVPMTSKLFSGITEALTHINEWFASHGSEISKFTETVGGTLARGFETAVHFATKLLTVVSKVHEHVSGAGMLAGSVLAPAAGAALRGGVMGAMGAGGVEILAPVIVALGTAAIGAYGAMNDLSNRLSYFHEAAKSKWAEIMGLADRTLAQLTTAFHGLEPVLRSIADIAGNNFLTALKAVALVANKIAENISLAVGAVDALARAVKSMMMTIYDALPTSAQAAWRATGMPDPNTLYNEAYKYTADARGKHRVFKERDDVDRLGRTSDERLTPPTINQYNTINMNIHQTGDPRSVARLVTQELENIKLKQAVGAFNFKKPSSI